MLIDEFMPEYQVSERHQIQANAPIELVQMANTQGEAPITSEGV